MVGCPERIFIVFCLLLSPFIRNLYVTLTSRKTFVFPFNDFAFLNAIDKFQPFFAADLSSQYTVDKVIRGQAGLTL